MTVTLGDLFARLVSDRAEALKVDDPQLKSAKARDLVTDFMFFASKFIGPELLGAAYGEVDEVDREGVLHMVAQRAHMMSSLFASLPPDAGCLHSVAIEAMAVKNGDAPALFARLPQSRKVAYRVTRAKFAALLWDVYLEARSITAAHRHSAITAVFGHDWDTVSRWIKPARSKLGNDYVDYMIAVARTEGRHGNAFTYDNVRPFGARGDQDSWEELLKRSGDRFLATQRASLGNA